MTEQPPPSAEALKLVLFVHSTTQVEAAAAIDALCEQRVSAETERCAQVALQYRDEADAGQHADMGDPDHSLGQGYAANAIAKRIRAPAERPAPPQQPDDIKYRCVKATFPCVFRPGPECPFCEQDSPQRIGVEQPTQDTDCPVGGTIIEQLREPNAELLEATMLSLEKTSGWLWADRARAVIATIVDALAEPSPPSALASTGEQPDKDAER